MLWSQPVKQPPQPPPHGLHEFVTHCVWQQPTVDINIKPLRQIKRCNNMGSLSLNPRRSVTHRDEISCLFVSTGTIGKLYGFYPFF